MKKILVIVFLSAPLFCPAQTNALVKEQEQSNAEKFSAKTGALIKREFIWNGKLADAEIKIIHYTDMITGEKTHALRFEAEKAGKYTSDTKIATLDPDEVDGLMKAIKIMKEKVFDSIPQNYTEVTFRARGGFEAGCFWSKGKWDTYLKLEKFDGDSYVWLKKEDFEGLITLLQLAKLEMK